jgi:3-hydroxyacyl-CoA dehydrogenase/enoyl-CoA hydratase/3-hydroxybutyryl-CoA epimerase
MGPVRLLDEVGLDVASHVSEIMVKGYGPRMEAPPLAAKLAKTGALGKKSGVGFYDFTSKKPRRDLASVLALPKQKETSPDIQERLIFALLNEAVLCLDEGVAGAPGPDAAKQIDLGSVMGFGFPPFRGGILYWAQKKGFSSIIEKFKDLEKKYGSRFKPTESLTKWAKKGFYP